MADPMVDEYLYRLNAAARVLPDDRRRELVDEIATHIAESRNGATLTGEAGLRTLLDRLGEPEEIVAAARDADGPYQTPVGVGAPGFGPQFSADGTHVRELRRAGTGIETAAVIMLTAGSIIPIVGWVVGVVLLWTSRRWLTWEKVLATLVFPGGPGLVSILAAVGVGGGSCPSSSSGSAGGPTVVTEHCTSTGLPVAVGALLFAVWVIAPIVVAIVLLVRVRNRAAAEPLVAY